MKKLLKILAWTAAALLALAVVLLVSSPLWLGPTVKAVANGVVPDITGTGFKIERASLNPLTGQFTIEGIDLANPEGFPVPSAFTLTKLHVDLAVGSLFTDTLRIREIAVDNPYVSYVSANGTNNFEYIAAHAQEKLHLSEKEDEDKDKSKTKLVIERFRVTGTRVKVSVMPEIPLPEIVMTDIGKDAGGATGSEVVAAVWDAVQRSLTSAGGALSGALNALGGGAAGLLDGATDGVKDGVKDAGKLLGDGAQGAADGAKAVGGAIGDGAKAVGGALGDGAKAVGEGAKDAFKKVGNLFGN